MTTTFDLVLLAALVLFSGAFSASETALISVSRFKVKLFVKQNRHGAYALAELKKNPHKMLITILIGNNLVNVTASVMATKVALILIPYNPLAVATGIMTFLILVFGEIVPKNLATNKAEGIAMAAASPIYLLSKVLFPLIWVFDMITVKIFRVRPLQPKITEEEVRNIVDIAKEEGGIAKEETELIHKIFRFDDTDVEEIKVPRTDIVLIEKASSLKDVIKLINKCKHSRIPVYSKSREKIVGIFYLKDALSLIEQKKYSTPLSKLMRKPLFVPETKKINETLRLFQKKNQQMAIIIDEYGGVSGLVTVENILEEIVGELYDETDRIDPEIKKVAKRTYNVLGKADIEEVNKKLKARLEITDDYETFSGYILNKIGRIPDEGEEIVIGKLVVRIIQVKNNRIISTVIKV